jgi:uncharacterized membrane protein
MSTELLDRLDRLERRLVFVEDALGEILGTRLPSPAPEPEWTEPVHAAPPPPPTPAPAPRVTAPPAPPRPRREIDWSVVFGAKGLAAAGALVTVLGIVFFFALAVNRGWIGPGERVAFGAVASAIVFLAGLELRRRYGRLHAPLAAVAAGIAGGYATLLAATAIYELVPSWAALLIAATIAGLGLAVSLAWREEIIAAIGLVGAMVVPALLIFDTGLTAVSTAFVAIMFAAAATVAVTYRWRGLLIAAAVVGAPQALVLFAGRGHPEAGLLVLAAVFAALYLGAGIAHQLRNGKGTFDRIASSLIVSSAGFVFLSALALFSNGDPLDRGVFLLALAGAYGALGAFFFARRGGRDLGTVLIALALALGAVGVADALSGGSLTYVWAAEAAALAWIAWRLREIRFEAGAFAYLGLALLHSLVVEAPLSQLFVFTEHPADGALSVAAVSIAAGIAAACALDWQRVAVRTTTAALSAVLAVEALSLALLELYVTRWPGGGDSAFDHGQIAVTGLWSAAGVLAVVIGLRRRGHAVAAAGLIWLGVVAAKALAFDAKHLDGALSAYSFLEIAGALLLATVLVQALRPRLWPDPTTWFLTVGASLALTLIALAELLDGRVQGAAFLGVAVLYGSLAAGFLLRDDRGFATLLWSLAAVVAAIAAPQLLGGQWLVAVWAAAGAAFAPLVLLAGERRFRLGATFYLWLAFALSFFTQATPADLFSANENPAHGVPGLVAVVLALLVAVRLPGVPARPARDALDRALDEMQPRVRTAGTWFAGGLALYALSLVILQVAEWIGPRDVASNFQSGHTAVSAVWGALGLTLLYVGLRGRHTAVRVGGLVLFGVSLAKLFVYDLSNLSSITRALSFLAVGAVLLLGGFFYQRLGTREDGRQAPA